MTGASGFLGWHVCQVAQAEWEVIGAYRENRTEISGEKFLKADLTRRDQIESLLASVKPDAIVHLAANSDPNSCQRNPTDSRRINVEATRHIAELCQVREIPLAFASTDLVFDGLNPPYSESDPPSPVSCYGEQKVESEALLESIYPKAAICRLPLMFGNAPPHATSFLQPFVNTLRERREVKLFTDEIRTPVSGTTAAAGLLLALRSASGLIHLGGREEISRYDFGQLMVRVLDLPGDGLIPSRQEDVQMSAPRPPNVSLDSSQAFQMGYAPASVAEQLASLKGLV